MDVPSTTQSSLLDELDAKQNAVIAQLDDLNREIEQVLQSLASGKQSVDEAA